MQSLISKGGHSAQVKMQLKLHGKTLSVGQLGPDFLLLDNPIDVAGGEAMLTVQIDDSEQTWKVKIPDGVSAGCDRVALQLPD